MSRAGTFSFLATRSPLNLRQQLPELPARDSGALWYTSDRDARIAALEHRVAYQDAMLRVISDRIGRIECVEEPDLSGSATICQAAHDTGYSQSGIRKRIASRKIIATKRGGHWFIDRASLMPKVRSG